MFIYFYYIITRCTIHTRSHSPFRYIWFGEMPFKNNRSVKFSSTCAGDLLYILQKTTTHTKKVTFECKYVCSVVSLIGWGKGEFSWMVLHCDTHIRCAWKVFSWPEPTTYPPLRFSYRATANERKIGKDPCGNGVRNERRLLSSMPPVPPAYF